MTSSSKKTKAVASTNGTTSELSPLIKTLSGFTFERSALVRIIAQSLDELGYSNASQALQLESNTPVELPVVRRFKDAVSKGQWDQAEQLAHRLSAAGQGTLEERKHNSSKVQHLLVEQQYVELLGDGKVPEALELIRTKLDGAATELRQRLAYLLMIEDKSKLSKAAGWDSNCRLAARKSLLRLLQVVISPSVMLPPQRMITLLDHAFRRQVEQCVHHTPSDGPVSLLHDHQCDRGRSFECIHVLTDHSDQVTFACFSHRSRLLATTSIAKEIFIWQFSPDPMVKPSKDTTLGPCQTAASFLAWSPDDRRLLSCGDGCDACIWDIATGTVVLIVEHSEDITGGAWVSNDSFATTSADCSLGVWDMDGVSLASWKGEVMRGVVAYKSRLVAISDHVMTVHDVCVSPPAADSISRPPTCMLRRRSSSCTFMLTLSSLAIDSRCKYALVSTRAPSGVMLWNLEQNRRVRTFRGPRQTRFVVRATFAGVNDSLVVSGSEDSQVYVWHRNTGQLIQVLDGHSGPVNAVSFLAHQDTYTGIQDTEQAECASPLQNGNGLAHTQDREPVRTQEHEATPTRAPQEQRARVHAQRDAPDHRDDCAPTASHTAQCTEPTSSSSSSNSSNSSNRSGSSTTTTTTTTATTTTTSGGSRNEESGVETIPQVAEMQTQTARASGSGVSGSRGEQDINLGGSAEFGAGTGSGGGEAGAPRAEDDEAGVTGAAGSEAETRNGNATAAGTDDASSGHGSGDVEGHRQHANEREEANFHFDDVTTAAGQEDGDDDAHAEYETNGLSHGKQTNSRKMHLIASVSDDHTVRIWGMDIRGWSGISMEEREARGARQARQVREAGEEEELYRNMLRTSEERQASEDRQAREVRARLAELTDTDSDDEQPED